MTQPSVRAVTAVDTSTASPSVAKPTGTASGDLLFAAVSDVTGTLANIGTPTGGATWTLLSSRDDTALKSKIFWKVAGGSEPSTYGFTLSGSTFDACITVIAVQNGATSTPTVANVSSGSGASVNTPGVTPPDAVSLEIRYAATQGGEFGFEWSAVPASYTEIAPLEGAYTVSCAAWRQLPSGSATGTLAFTASETPSGTRHGFTIAIAQGSISASVDIPAAIAVPATLPTPAVSAGSSATPATIAVSGAMPAPGVSAGSSATPATIAVGTTMPLPTVTAEDAEIVTPDTIAVTTAMPAPAVQANASAAPATITVVTAMPPPTVTADAAVTLSTIAVQVAMPRPVVAVPPLPGDRITRWGQIEWNGFLLGEATPYSWQGLEGWRDLPPIISGNVDQPNDNGSYAGQPYAGERVINWGTLLQSRPDQIGQLLRDLQMATGRSQTEEEGALVIWDFAGAEPYLVYGHLTNRAPGSIDQQAAQVGLMRGALQWTCSGPEILSVIRQSLPIPINTETDVLNNGNEASRRVVYRIPGPCSTPQIENLTLDRVFGFDVDIADGEILEIDVKNGNVTIGVADYLNKLIEGSTSVKDFVLAPGVNRLLWSAETGGTLLNVLWRHSSL